MKYTVQITWLKECLIPLNVFSELKAKTFITINAIQKWMYWRSELLLAFESYENFSMEKKTDI